MRNMKRLYIYAIMLLGLLVAGCQKEKDPVKPLAAPVLVSTVPEDGASDLEGETLTVTLTFNQSVRCPTATQSQITVDEGAKVDRISTYLKDMTVEISALEAGKSYTLVFPKGTVLGMGENQDAVEEIRFSFSMKYVAPPEPYVPSVLDPVKALVNPKASREAQNVYAFLLEQSGKMTLSGVQSSHSHKNDFVDFIYDNVGKHPALAGYDFLFLQYSPTPDNWSWVQNYNDISAPKEQWAANGLVNYMWHWNVPDSEAAWKAGIENGDFNGYAFYCNSTSFDINEALKPGTWQNEFIMKDIEEVAGYLQLLEDENIPVIWRPLHEAAGNYDIYGGNGAWFWWGRGGAEPCKALWRLLYDQLVNVHGLDNLIWVWTADVPEAVGYQHLEWYPGDEFVDIVGVDIYESNVEAKSRQYQMLVDMTKGKKLVTISECGNIPHPDKCMAAGDKWSWFMVWCTTDSNGNLALSTQDWSFNTLSHWTSVMNSPYVINREDMPSLK